MEEVCIVCGKVYGRTHNGGTTGGICDSCNRILFAYFRARRIYKTTENVKCKRKMDKFWRTLRKRERRYMDSRFFPEGR